jgi:hypothetical protein
MTHHIETVALFGRVKVSWRQDNLVKDVYE